MFKFKLILAIFALLASFLCLPTASAQPFPEGNYAELRQMDKAEVLEVISPQTMKLSNGDIIHLSAVHFIDDTPGHTGPFAVTALNVLKDMLEGETVLVYQTKKKDWGRTNRMGHVLAHIVRQKDNAWVQGTLVGLGLAQVQTSLRTPEMAAQLYALEKAARKNKTGIWAQDAKILAPENIGEYINSFQIVEGVIESAALKKNRIYLNFGKNWRDDFTVSIPPENRRAFSKAGINPFDWNGKKIRVRGWVEDYNGPYIEIDHPEAIEMLSTK